MTKGTSKFLPNSAHYLNGYTALAVNVRGEFPYYSIAIKDTSLQSNSGSRQKSSARKLWVYSGRCMLGDLFKSSHWDANITAPIL